MSKQVIDGGPAFPEPERFNIDGTPFTGAHGYRQPGMSLRDWFAGQALAGLLANSYGGYVGVADDAYRFADAMLASREAKTEEATD